MSPVRARTGISLLFFVNGATFTNLVPRLPQIKHTFGLADGVYGLTVALGPLGALVAAMFAVFLIRRFGARRVAVFGSLIICLAIAALGFAPKIWVVGLFMVLAGAADSVTDAAQNVHAVQVEDYYQKSIMNSLHALWSLGAAVGAAIGAAAAEFDIPIGWHLSASGLVLVAVAITAGKLADVPPKISERNLSDESTSAKNETEHALDRAVWVSLILLGVLAVSGVIVEDFGSSWSVLYLNREAGATIGTAGLGYTVIIGVQFIGRIIGDPLTDRFGRVNMVRLGGVLIALGGLIVVAFPIPWAVFVGYALMGYGCATIIPGAYAAAGRLPGLKEGTGITVVSWIMRAGMLVSSPIIGALAQATSLRVGSGLVLVSGLAIIALASKTRTSTS